MSCIKFNLGEQVKRSLLELMDNMLSSRSAVRLPSEKQLSDMLQVSRGTIRAALAELESEGRIFRRHGSGTYLNTRVSEVSGTLYPHMYFGELIARNGYQPSIRILGVSTQRDEKISACLGLESESDVICLQKLYQADGIACIYVKDYFDKHLFLPEHIESMETKPVSIYQFFTDCVGMTVAWDMRRLGVTDTQKTPELARYANIPKGSVKPYLWVNSTAYDTNDRPMFLGDSYIDTEMLDLYLILNQMKGPQSYG